MTISPVFLEAYGRLPRASRTYYDTWVTEVTRFDGNLMPENFKTEQQLEPDTFHDLLIRITSLFGSQLTSGTLNPLPVLFEACKQAEFKYQGKESLVSPNTVLHIVVNLRDLRLLIAEAMGLTDPVTAWDEFNDTRLTNADRIEYLKYVYLDPRKSMIWAYFDETDGSVGTASDPLHGRTAEETCSTLGLPNVWRNYGPGAEIWKIKYLPSTSTVRYIPTITDANGGGWNTYFQPIDESRLLAKWGYTWDMNGPRGKRGMPEIIHEGWKDGSEQGAIIELPELVGIR